MIEARDYASPADVRAMQELLQELWAIERERTFAHIGDLAWGTNMHVGREQEWRRRLWFDGGRCVAWAWVKRPGELDYVVHLDHRGSAVHEAVLDWFETAADEGALTTYVLDGDETSALLLSGRGFDQAVDGKWLAYFVRDLDGTTAEVPDGFVARTVRGDEDLHARVEVHRAVWAPSRVTEESYRNVMRAWPYRADLDCVLEGADGAFAAYVLCWFDELNHVGEFEPVGTHPSYQRRGLGRAVCSYALQRLYEEGARTAIVYAAADETCAFYESVGFRRHTTLREVRKERP